MASLITQLAIVVIITVANNLVLKYGYNTYSSTGEVFGVVTPLAIIGICMKVFGIVISIVIGVSLGGQPIIGYNMGAGNVDRVKETCRKILFTNCLISLMAFIILELFPDMIIDTFAVYGIKHEISVIGIIKRCNFLCSSNNYISKNFKKCGCDAMELSYCRYTIMYRGFYIIIYGI
ncbi:hypothetical protein FYJ71_01500 [Peptostreptococcus anaerobius]|uniref:MatE protein n=1 Tax=Peptostreptococcus porci TaxID=2652282 RepID=A0A6N7XEL5_9FIRM|nr:MATE family efflux transporter [Peptostreptococcus porci]MST61649.1 hypothetical protein [Peptostreptococcus porci]